MPPPPKDSHCWPQLCKQPSSKPSKNKSNTTLLLGRGARMGDVSTLAAEGDCVSGEQQVLRERTEEEKDRERLGFPFLFY